MPKVKINQLEFYYERYGKGEPVVFLNGIYGNTSSWYYQIEALKKNFELIVYDMRDQGHTEKPESEYPFSQHVDDLYGLMQALELKQAHLIGISYGASVAMHFAARYPAMVNKMVLISAISELSEHQRTLFQMLHHLNDNCSLADYYKYLMFFAISEITFDRIAPQIDAFAADFESRFKNTGSSERLRNAGKNGQFPVTEALCNLAHETLVVVGEKDIFTPLSRAQLIHRMMKNSVLKVVAGSGHSVHIEKPLDLNLELMKFFKILP